MCRQWKDSFEAFEKWAIESGYVETECRNTLTTLDRIDVNGNYSPDNCRLTTQKEQMRNVRYNHYEVVDGKKMTIAEISEKYGIPYSRILQRVNKYGYSIADAIK